MIHRLKTDSKYFDAVWNRKKEFEVRLNDRDFKVMDALRLFEIDENGNYTGREIQAEIIYILEGGIFGIDKKWCVLGLRHFEFDNFSSDDELPFY